MDIPHFIYLIEKYGLNVESKRASTDLSVRTEKTKEILCGWREDECHLA
jgi:hypothetical protein